MIHQVEEGPGDSDSGFRLPRLSARVTRPLLVRSWSMASQVQSTLPPLGLWIKYKSLGDELRMVWRPNSPCTALGGPVKAPVGEVKS